MKLLAVCIQNSNDFDLGVGAVVEVEDLYITRIWRDGEVVETENPARPGYHLPENVLLSMLREGDTVEDNYCHGRYRVV